MPLSHNLKTVCEIKATAELVTAWKWWKPKADSVIDESKWTFSSNSPSVDTLNTWKCVLGQRRAGTGTVICQNSTTCSDPKDYDKREQIKR